ncbi:hypothetical protein F4806DRAFT_477864 [Annulohypoxylon nitens]|nr:hypothetical protein F4806DRAFT_477864 [Annulohypoxylon nitens]
MTCDSAKAAYDGVTPSKPGHRFSTGEPALHPTNTSDYRYQLTQFTNGPSSVPVAHLQNRDPGVIEAAHVAQVTATVASILPHLQ